MKKRTKILAFLALAFIVMQFFRIDKTNPPSNEAEDFIKLTGPPAAVASLLKEACYDCHSHQTVYPWYSNVAPISFFLRGHIRGAREHLNFSKWGSYSEDEQKHKLEEIAEEVKENRMPMKSYANLHSKAKMSSEQKTTLVDWVKSQKNKVGKKGTNHEVDDLSQYGIGDDPANQLGGLKIGEIAPNFNGVDQEGNKVSLEEKLKTGPVVLIFYRGYWCGYCSKQLGEFEEKLTELKSKNASIIAVSPEHAVLAKQMVVKSKTSVPIISDADQEIMKNYKVAFRVTQAYQDKVKNYVKKDLNEMSGYDQATLPVPATYVINQDGKIAYVFYNPDYSKRATVDDILKAL